MRAAVRAYAERHPALVAAAARAERQLGTILDEAGINYLAISARAKAVASFADKATRTDETGALLYPDPLRDIGDQVGVRVITYVRSDVEAVAGLLAAQSRVLDDRDLGEVTASEGRFGYASRHLQVALPVEDAGGAGGAEDEQVVQVQLRTVLQHAWAEFEHDIRYKGSVPAEHASEFDRRFTLAAGLLELADREFSAVRDRLRGAPVPERADDDPRIAPRELAAFLAGQYDDAGWSRTDHYLWVSGLLLELGITTLQELSETLRDADEDAIAERMDYRYPPGAVRRLDDALLFVFGERYLALHGNAHRRDLLETRWERLRTAAP
nr:(p)ppGpp synthetase [Nocardioides flavescens]